MTKQDNLASKVIRLLQFDAQSMPRRLQHLSCTAICLVLSGLLAITPASFAADESRLDVALSLAKLLRVARTVIASHQTLINDESKGNKGLTGDLVVASIIEKLSVDNSNYAQLIGGDTQAGRLMQLQLDAFKEILDENQTLINKEDIGFKGFVPAVFAQLSNERFSAKAGGEAVIKVTAPNHLVRNRKARPDAWEKEVIKTKLARADWPVGELFAELVSTGDESKFRVLVPEYYGQACLACHGEPMGEVDVTGYPKEGGKLGDLGGAISITLSK